jgi:hypothetical protein
METAIPHLSESENNHDTKKDFRKIDKIHFTCEYEQDYEEFTKDMTRILELKEDLFLLEKFTNNSSNNDSFIEMNPQIWDNKILKRDDSLKFLKNFEKIKKQKHQDDKNKDITFSSNSKINTNRCSGDKLNKLLKQNKCYNVCNFPVENENFGLNNLLLGLDSPDYKKIVDNKNENLSKSSNSPVSSSTCWSGTENRNLQDAENSDRSSKSPDTLNIHNIQRGQNDNSFNYNYCNNYDNFLLNENRSSSNHSQLETKQFIHPPHMPTSTNSQALNYQKIHNFNISSNYVKNPFDSLHTNEFIGKSNKKQLDEAANRINRENVKFY